MAPVVAGMEISHEHADIDDADADADTNATPSQAHGGWGRGVRRVVGQPLRTAGAFLAWMRQLRAAFGTPFVAIAIAGYAVSQGIGESIGTGFGADYYYKDVQKLEPASSQQYVAIADIPWAIKPVYGLISDSLPLFGLHRRPYIIISGALGIVAWLWLAAGSISPAVACFCFFLANLSIGFPDVVIDAAVAERCATHPHLAADLQSLCWGSLAVGLMVGVAVAALVIGPLGARGALAITAVSPLILLACAGMMPDKRRDYGGLGLRQVFWSQLKKLMIAVRNPAIHRPALYIYLSKAVAPSVQQALFYWITEAPDGPAFSPRMIGMIEFVALIGMLVGVAVYNNYLTNMPYRRIFMWAQVLMMSAGMLDLVIVTRTNKWLGIPDQAFVIADQAVAEAVERIQTMPVLVLAARVCPANVEGTLFALLMSLSNFGEDTSEFFGAWLLRVLGVSRADFSLLWLAVLIRSLMRLLPLMLLFLVPDLPQTGTLLDAAVANKNSEGAVDNDAVDDIDSELRPLTRLAEDRM
eukprot:jgi/Chlat1/1977/Chrsp158S02283